MLAGLLTTGNGQQQEFFKIITETFLFCYKLPYVIELKNLYYILI